jgi:phosphoribosylamine--glycine ligase
MGRALGVQRWRERFYREGMAMVKPAVIGRDGRTTAITRILRQSPRVKGDVPCLSPWKGKSVEAALQEVVEAARTHKPDFVFIGPEEPLAEGVVDALQKIGIPCVGPTQELARLESSKAFTRDLLTRHKIPGNPEHRIFTGLSGLESYLRELGEFVVKPDGLTGGKGVKVSGSHLVSSRDAVEYAEELFRAGHHAVVIEEKLDGEEFSLQSFCDGSHVVDMVVVQDHKRAEEGDRGPNTGGMGSYSCEDHRLPFLSSDDVRTASAINAAVARALLLDTGARYRGILYGGFMLTRHGVRLLEYNARFGDPEALNVLSLLRTDLVDICEAIIQGTLDRVRVDFEHLATVCKYVVPKGYPDGPVKGERIDLDRVPKESERLKYYFAAVDERPDGLYLTGSRAIGFVGIGASLDEAEEIAEKAASAVGGPVYHRSDIGTRKLIQQRSEHIRQIRGVTAAPRT